ncbi:MAG: SU10 major capsid protein [Bacteroidales bacterium]
MATLNSYDLNGKKLSFANWISNLSPVDVPFTSMTGKESIQQTLFQWQTDSLAKASKNAIVEGDKATEDNMHSTLVKTNVTQILRKVVKVSDTADALANYGRGKELQYQMEKAGKEIKRDLEHAFLNNEGSVQGDSDTARSTAGFHALVAGLNQTDPSTGAVVHNGTKTVNSLTEEDIFGMTYNLYLSGSDANIIMFHPKWASVFSGLQEKAAPGNRQRIFENTPKFSVYVATLVDPLGREYKLVPNRWMPETKIYFFNPSDWTQMVLRAPQRTKLAKDGSYEKWMIEMEVGLRHRNPYASGVLEIFTEAGSPGHKKDEFLDTSSAKVEVVVWTGSTDRDISASPEALYAQVGTSLKVKLKTKLTNCRVSVLKSGSEVWGKTSASAAIDLSAGEVIIDKLTKADAGSYVIQITDLSDTANKGTYQTFPLVLSVGDNSTEGSAGNNTQPGFFSAEA